MSRLKIPRILVCVYLLVGCQTVLNWESESGTESFLCLSDNHNSAYTIQRATPDDLHIYDTGSIKDTKISDKCLSAGLQHLHSSGRDEMRHINGSCNRFSRICKTFFHPTLQLKLYEGFCFSIFLFTLAIGFFYSYFTEQKEHCNVVLIHIPSWWMV